ncbi:MAG: DUF4921 family protein [bacterium]
MNRHQPLYQTLPDGTLKHVNPLSGTEVWTVPSRAHRPFKLPAVPVQALSPVDPENYCDFCPSAYLNTPPEKSRLVQIAHNVYEKIIGLPPDQFDSSRAVFRRVANLFEIVTLDYWIKNHGFNPSPRQLQFRKDYLGNSLGRDHALRMIDTKLIFSGYSPEARAGFSELKKLAFADAFFFGSHDLIITQRHYISGAKTDNQYCSSGELSIEEHRRFFRFTLDALDDLYAQNLKIRYISVFQNWLHPAGASFNHLHKQLVGMDEWGVSIRRELEAVRENPNIYNEQIIDFAKARGLILAENQHAIALCEWGHRYPTLAVYSKSPEVRPQEQTWEELSDFSDLVHACHAASGSQIPCNEEWFFAPRDADLPIPWHVLIKWRTLQQAGFEGGTKIYINPLAPEALRNQMAAKLLDLRKTGKIADFRIGDECVTEKNSLLYGRKENISH